MSEDARLYAIQAGRDDARNEYRCNLVRRLQRRP